MIFGAVGVAARIPTLLEELATELGRPPIAASVNGQTAIAAWSGVPMATCSSEHAYVGHLRGPVPAPGVELRGDFAMVARRGATLQLSRAAFSGRPLYWMRMRAADVPGGRSPSGRAADVTVACSQLLPLALLGRRQLRLNVDHILALFDAAIDMPLPFEGVSRVPLNAIVSIDAAGQAETHFGPVKLGDPLTVAPGEVARCFREELQQAVTRQTAGVDRIAVMTSGGVDSSNLLALAMQNKRAAGPQVVPVAFDMGGPGDDRPHLRALCRHLQVEPIRVSPHDVASYSASPVLDATASSISLSPVVGILRAAKEAGADVALFGHGSEYVSHASPEVFGDFLIHTPLRALTRLADYRMIGQSRAQTIRFLLLGPLYRLVAPTALRRARARHLRSRAASAYLKEHGWIAPRLAASLARHPEQPEQPPIRDQRAQLLALASGRYLEASVEFLARLESHVGLRISLPYLDDDFVRFMGRVSSAHLFMANRERSLLRESMAGLVPESLRYRMDKALGDQGDKDLFVASGGYESVRDLVTMEELERLGVVDGRAFQRAFRRFAENPYATPAAAAIPFWTALHAEAYVRWFLAFVSEGRDAARAVTRLGHEPSLAQ
jgi:asparagine synthetase B (glutamine-hydrolysing)